MTTKPKFTIHGNKKAVMPNEHDRRMIDFLWHHRVASFRTLHRLFYSHYSVKSCYNRLYKFRKYNFLSVKTAGEFFGRYWTLGDRGLAFFANENGSAINAIGSRPQSFKHDHLSSAILLGDWYLGKPPLARLITEQMLLASNEDDDKLLNLKDRRPDGLWEFKIGPERKYVALEVELHAKTESEYANIIAAHDIHYRLDKIIWVVRGSGLMQKIHKLVMEKAMFKSDGHLFLLLNEVENKMWQAKFKNDRYHGITLSQLLNSYLGKPFTPPMSSPGNSLGNSQVTASNDFVISDLLDLSIPLGKSSTYTNTEILENV